MAERGGPGFGDRRQQARQRLLLLQVAEAGGVRRGNVDGEIAGDAGEALHSGDVVGDAVGAVAVGAEVDPDDAAFLAFGEAGVNRIVALTVEAEPVDEGVILGRTEQARARIATLRPRRDAADLDESEAEAKCAVRHLAVLVEACGEADGVGEVEPENAPAKTRVGRPGAGMETRGQRAERQLVGDLRVEGEEQRPEPCVDHGTRPGKTWRPSAPSGSALTQRASFGSSGP